MSEDAMLEKAKQILADSEAKRQRVKTCGDAGLCAKCGDKLVHVWTKDMGDYPAEHHLRCGNQNPCGQWKYWFGTWAEEPVQSKLDYERANAPSRGPVIALAVIVAIVIGFPLLVLATQ